VTGPKLMAEIGARGGHLWLYRGRLHGKPAAAFDRDLVLKIQAHRPQIIAELRAREVVIKASVIVYEFFLRECYE
jgi:hypothetical protein